MTRSVPAVRLLVIAAIAVLFLTNSLASARSSVPAGSTQIARIEESSDWKTCGSCGNNGGGGTKAHYHMTRGITSPNLDGSSTEFWIGGPHPFKNAYWFIEHSGSPSKPLSYLRYEFDIYVPSDAAKAPQAIEFECQQKAEGFIYNFAWQADYADHEWRIFNYKAHRWERTGMAFGGFLPDRWHHVVAEFHSESGTVVHDALTIDGVRRNVGIRHEAKRSGRGHYLTNAFQLDLNGDASAYKVYVDRMTVTYK